MTAIPVPGARALSRNARRTALVRGALAVTTCALVLLVAAAGRHPRAGQPSSLPVRSGDVILLDLSSSISSDTGGRTPLRVVGLNAAPDDEAFFARIAGAAVTEAAPAPATPAPPPTQAARGSLPLALVLAIVAAVVALAAYGLWTARLRWDTGDEAS